MNIIAYGLDYARFKLHTVHDERFVGERFMYLETYIRRFHGSTFIDMTGKQIEIVRIFESIDAVMCELASLYPVNRLDVFVDVEGDMLNGLPQRGTTIHNDGKLETIYSHHLKKRGNCPTFGRAYDAMAAGHYPCPVTRFEIEYKREHARALLGVDGWKVCPIGVTTRNIRAMFGVDIEIENITDVDLNAPQRRMSHNRERFYSRYGNNIALDMETMGYERFYTFIMECLRNKES